MTRIKRILLTASVFGLSIMPTHAYAAEEVFKLCDALSQEKTYEDDKDFRFIVAGKDGWIYRTDMDFKDKEFELSDWSKTSFGRLSQAFEKQGTKLAVVMIPTRGIVGYAHALPPYAEKYDHAAAKAGYAGLLDTIEGAGLIVADTRDVDTVPGYFLKRDNHWTAEGAKYAAQRVAEAIKKDPIYETLRKTEFVTTSAPAGEDDQANDRFLEFIEEVCDFKVPSEMLPAIYSTAPKDSKAAADMLLGTQETPEIVLLGTSNSTSPEPSFANFAGYLRESLSADVQNEAISGGAFRGSIANFVFQGDYARTKPKIIVWELSAHYGFDQKPTFREVIPALYGECTGDNIVAENKGSLQGKATPLFEDLTALNIFENGYYLYLKLDDTNIRDFKIEFLHNGSKNDTFKVERSERNFPQHDGLFFVELKNGIDGALKMPVLQSKKELAGGFVAKMCKIPQTEAAAEAPKDGASQ